MTLIWTGLREQRLRDLYTIKTPYHVIAAEFGVTRGAIAGAISRLKMADRAPGRGKGKRWRNGFHALHNENSRKKAPDPITVPPKVTRPRPVAELEAEIRKIRDDTVASRCKVDGSEWRAAVQRCKELRALIGKRKPRGRPRKKVVTPGMMGWNMEKRLPQGVRPFEEVFDDA